jgi:hypothetical protein
MSTGRYPATIAAHPDSRSPIPAHSGLGESRAFSAQEAALAFLFCGKRSRGLHLSAMGCAYVGIAITIGSHRLQRSGQSRRP